MAREHVAVSDDYCQDWVGALTGDGSLWGYLYVRDTRVYSKGKVRDISWSFCGPAQEGSQSQAVWWATKSTLWNERTGETGDKLARLFVPPAGKKGANIRILYNVDDVYGEIDQGSTWWKLDAREHDVWLHKPLNRDMSEEQKAYWQEHVGDYEWVNLYTAQGGNPFYEKERQAQELVTAGVSISDDGLVDL